MEGGEGGTCMMMASSLSSPARHSNAITAARGNRPLMAITLQLSADGTGRGGGAVERSERHHGGVGGGSSSINLHSNQHLLRSDGM